MLDWTVAGLVFGIGVLTGGALSLGALWFIIKVLIRLGIIESYEAEEACQSKVGKASKVGQAGQVGQAVIRVVGR